MSVSTIGNKDLIMFMRPSLSELSEVNFKDQMGFLLPPAWL